MGIPWGIMVWTVSSPEKLLFHSPGPEGGVQVVERQDRREMRFGNRVVQSAYAPGDPDHLLLQYTQAMMLGFVLAPQAHHVLHIGLGGGSLARFIHRHFPQVQQVAVDINAQAIQAAFEFFDLPRSPRLQVVHGEGRAFLAQARQQFDLIFLDAFLAEGAPVDEEEGAFWVLLAERLAPGGWLVNNAWTSDRSRLEARMAQLKRMFGVRFVTKAGSASKVMLFASQVALAPSRAQMMEQAVLLSDSLPLDLNPWLARLKVWG